MPVFPIQAESHTTPAELRGESKARSSRDPYPDNNLQINGQPLRQATTSKQPQSFRRL